MAIYHLRKAYNNVGDVYNEILVENNGKISKSKTDSTAVSTTSHGKSIASISLDKKRSWPINITKTSSSSCSKMGASSFSIYSKYSSFIRNIHLFNVVYIAVFIINAGIVLAEKLADALLLPNCVSYILKWTNSTYQKYITPNNNLSREHGSTRFWKHICCFLIFILCGCTSKNVSITKLITDYGRFLEIVGRERIYQHEIHVTRPVRLQFAWKLQPLCWSCFWISLLRGSLLYTWHFNQALIKFFDIYTTSSWIINEVCDLLSHDATRPYIKLKRAQFHLQIIQVISCVSKKRFSSAVN